MSQLLIFRILIVSFVALYLLAMNTSGLPEGASAAALQYEEWAKAQPRTTSPVWGMLCLLGHVLDVVGLVLLFCRRRIGVYLLVAGFLSCLGTGSGQPFLETSSSATLMAFTNITWGAIVALALAVPGVLFAPRSEA